MILSRLSHLQRLVMRCQQYKKNSLMLKSQVYWFGSDRNRKDEERLFKKNSNLQKVNKSKIFDTSREENSDKRLFKKSSTQIIPNAPKQQSQPQPILKKQQQQQTKLQSLTTTTPHLQQQPSKPFEPKPSQQPHPLSSYKFHTCQLLLNDFKDHTKQSKNINSIIEMFNKYEQKIRENKVEDTGLSNQYKSIMFAAVMRAFSRILRREMFLQRAKLISFVGDDYEAMANLELSCLNTLELSDFVAFFFLFQMAYKFRTFSPAKIAVTDKYLKEIYRRYTYKSEENGEKVLKRSDYSEKQPKINDQRQDKRFVSELIILAKTAQMFHSPMYDKFLDLLLQNVNQQKLVPYKITSFVKFLLRPQNVTSVKKQLQLLNMLLKKMRSTDIMKDFDYPTLKQLYSNLIALVDNNHLLLDMSLGKAMINKIEQYAIESMPKMITEEIYQFVLFSFKRDGANNHQLGKYVLQYMFSQIQLNGQTSLNPLLAVYLVSTNVDEPVKFTQIDHQWQQKFINMYNLYLVGSQSLENLSYCQPQFTKLATHIHSEKIKQIIMQSLISPNKTCIIPYNQETFLKQNYFLQQNNQPKVLASLLRLQQMQPFNQKLKGLMKNVFDKLERSHVTEEVKKQLYEQEKAYIKGGEQVKVNRQGYVRTLSRYCFRLGHEELVYSVFAQYLISMVDHRADFHRRFSLQNVSDSKKKQFNYSRFNFPQTIDQKCRDKVNALFLNFISVTFELDLKLTKKQKDTEIQEKLKNNEFVSLIRSQQLFVDIFVEVLTLRDTATVVHYHGQEEKIKFLLELLRFLTIGNVGKSANKDGPNHKNQQKYYFVFYQILKNYPIQKLHKILVSPLCKQAVQKILNPKQQTLKASIMNAQKLDQNIKATRAHFTYDNSTGQVFIDEEQAKILRERVKKGLEIHTAQSKKGKIA